MYESVLFVSNFCNSFSAKQCVLMYRKQKRHSTFMRCQNQTSGAIQKVEADLSSSFNSDLSCNSSKNLLGKVFKKYDFSARPE